MAATTVRRTAAIRPSTPSGGQGNDGTASSAFTMKSLLQVPARLTSCDRNVHRTDMS